ncbi:MAG: hypothetical protein QW052_07245 [Candidatus Nitrosocaldaceae archaeon]
MQIKVVKWYNRGISNKEVQRVLNSALGLNVDIIVQENKEKAYDSKIIIERRLRRRGRTFRLFFGFIYTAFIEITRKSVTYSNDDFTHDKYYKSIAEEETVDGYMYFVRSIDNVPKPYYIPNRLIRHYLIIPKFEQFITELTAYLFITNTGPDQEQEITVTGKQAEEWISLIKEMTNLHIIYSKQSHT